MWIFGGSFIFCSLLTFRSVAGLINEYLQDIPQRRLWKKIIATAMQRAELRLLSCLTSKSCTYLHQRHCPKHWPRTKHNILWFPPLISLCTLSQPLRGILITNQQFIQKNLQTFWVPGPLVLKESGRCQLAPQPQYLWNDIHWPSNWTTRL